MSNYLERVKLLLHVTNQDELLAEIIILTTEKILSRINEDTIPSKLEWILIEASIKRFNKIGSEGITSENIEGSQISYGGDIEEYEIYFADYIEYKNNNAKRWRLF